MKIFDDILFAGDLRDIAFTQGDAGGSGFGTYTDKDGNRVIEADILVARMGARLNNLKVSDTEYMGGGFIFSSAGAEVVSVTSIGDSFRCSLKIKTGQDKNRFHPGDGAFCQRYDNGAYKYYWRRITAIGEDYIDISKTDCADGSHTPSAGDTIIQLGHLTDSKRQSAIYITTEGDSAPSFTMYGDIDGFTLNGKELSGHRFDSSSGEIFSYGYGSFFYGDQDTGHGIRYDRKKREFNIKGNVTIGPGSTGLTNLSEWEEKQQQINKAQQDAENATLQLNEWASDDIISPLEKQGLKDELAFISADYEDISLRYQKNMRTYGTYILKDGKRYITKDGFVLTVGVPNTSWHQYQTAYDAYKNDLIYKIGLDGPSEVGMLRTLQEDFYSARTKILDDITNSSKAEIEGALKTAREASGKVDGLTARLDDIKHIEDTFGKGQNLNVEGVVMTQMVAVAGENEGVEALLNGSKNIKDDEYGKLILAGGIPNDNRGLDVRAKEATTRIYENGRIVSKDIHLENGATIGNTVKVGDDGFFLKAGIDGQEILITEKNGFTAKSKFGGVAIVGGIAGTCLQISTAKGRETGLAQSSYDPYGMTVVTGEDEFAFYCYSGLFGGLRPNIRTITATSSASDKLISIFDHTILIESSLAITITLPAKPSLGQEYVFMMTNQESTPVQHTINGNGYNVFDVIGNNAKSDLQINSFGMVKLVFAQGATERRWYFYRLR